MDLGVWESRSMLFQFMGFQRSACALSVSPCQNVSLNRLGGYQMPFRQPGACGCRLKCPLSVSGILSSFQLVRGCGSSHLSGDKF